MSARGREEGRSGRKRDRVEMDLRLQMGVWEKGHMSARAKALKIAGQEYKTVT